jgi:subtilisin family serine protease
LDEYANGSAAGAMAGIEYVMTHGQPGDVANMSLGTRSPYAPLDEAVANAVKKGIRFVLAAGNDSVDTDSQSPARVHAEGVYTVSGMKYGDRWLDYSNYGSDAVNYCAPGDYVYSTYKDNTYAYDSGTSMAAPHVAGILLLNSFKTDGHVRFDPDGSPDPIMVYNDPRHT